MQAGGAVGGEQMVSCWEKGQPPMEAPVLRPGTTLSLGALLGQRCPPPSALLSRPWTLTQGPEGTDL